MSKATLITIKKELRGIVRDKKSLMMMVLTPLLIPVLIFLFSFAYDNLLNEDDIEIKYQIGINYELNIIEKNIIKELDFETIYFKTKDEMQKSFDNNEIDAYVVKNNTKYIIYSNDKGQDSSLAGGSFAMYLDAYNNYLAQNYLQSIDADLDKVYKNVEYDFEELKGESDLVNTIVTLGFVFAIMSITLTAIYGATDTTAGEKERGTLETFLTFPIKSEELIKGKYFAIVLSCLITSIISTILTVGSLLIASNMFEIYNDISFNFNIITISIGLLIMFLFSIFISGLCISIASKSKSYKEAQSALTPVSFLAMIPMFFDILKIEITPIISMIPTVNHTMLLELVFTKTLEMSDYLNIGIMIVSSVLFTIIILKLISRQYKSEKVLFSI